MARFGAGLEVRVMAYGLLMVYVYCLWLCIQFIVNGDRLLIMAKVYGFGYGLRLRSIVCGNGLWIMVYGYSVVLWLGIKLWFVVMVLGYGCRVLCFRFHS